MLESSRSRARGLPVTVASLALVISVAACSATAGAGDSTAASSGSVSSGSASSGSAPSGAAGPLKVLEQQAFIPVPDAFEELAAFDSIWIGSNIAGTITRIDPKTNQVVARVKVSTFTSGLAATDDGVWLIDGDARAVREIDPATNKLTDRRIPINDDGGGLGSANGALWQIGHKGIQRIDPASGKVTHVPAIDSCDPCGVGIGPDGIYVVRDGTLTRFGLDGSSSLATNATDVSGMVGVGPDALYAGSSTASVAILDPLTLELRATITSEPAVDAAGSTWQLGNASDGSQILADATGAWIRFSPATVARVDEQAKTITLYGGPFPSESSLTAIAVLDGSLWVTNTGEGSGGADGGDAGVYRVALPTP